MPSATWLDSGPWLDLKGHGCDSGPWLHLKGREIGGAYQHAIQNGVLNSNTYAKYHFKWVVNLATHNKKWRPMPNIV